MRPSWREKGEGSVDLLRWKLVYIYVYRICLFRGWQRWGDVIHKISLDVDERLSALNSQKQELKHIAICLMLPICLTFD